LEQFSQNGDILGQLPPRIGPLNPTKQSLTRDGQVRSSLKTPWRDCTTHVVFEPLDFIARMAALIILALQVNIRCGALPLIADNGITYLKLPPNAL
tara:strand:- start:3 stop:290 length:288 start_codon:yes stop_codon:yes gene_type:complete